MSTALDHAEVERRSVFDVPPVSVAIMSGSGGLGKTVTALAIAGAWSQVGPVLLVDTDQTKEAGTASDWLDRADPEPVESLTWATSTQGELVGLLGKAPRPVVVDTPPGMKGDDARALAAAVDAVIVVGSVIEMREIVQAARTVAEAGSTPVAAVLTRTNPVTDSSTLGTSARMALDGAGVVVVGSVRRYAALEVAKLNRGLPHLVTDHRVQADVEATAVGLGRWLAKVVG